MTAKHTESGDIPLTDGGCELLWETAQVMAPRERYPRRIGINVWRDNKRTFDQLHIETPYDLVTDLDDADGGSNRYVSVYGFPDGHPKHGRVPLIDTLFIDFDIPQEDVGELIGDEEGWSSVLRPMLMTISAVAREMVAEGKAKYWRASLSGLKGIHLYCDFPPLDVENMEKDVVSAGLLAFSKQVINGLDEYTPFDLWKYVDTVVLGDLSRLCRMPNTIHPEATEHFNEPRYCVPVEMEDLMGLSPEDYAELCRSPQLPDSWRRVESKFAGLTAEQAIYTAMTSGKQTNGDCGIGNNKEVDSNRVRTYKREHDGDMTVDDIWFLLEQTPCIKEYAGRDDQFHYGNESHIFEMFVMRHLIQLNVPYESIVDFFRGMNRFDEQETRYRLNYMIGSHKNPISCETVWEYASEFCLGNQCSIYDRHNHNNH